MQQVESIREHVSRLFRKPAATEPSLDDQIREFVEETAPTPIYISQRTRIILLAAMVVVLIWLAMEAPSVPRLLAIGATVALTLSFPVRMLQRWMPRGLAILVVVGSTVAFAIIGLILVIPYSIREISEFVTQFPETLENLESLLRDVVVEMNQRGWIDQDPDTVINDLQGNLLDRAEILTQTVLNNALEALTRSFSIAITTFGVIFVATYLLIDIPRFKEKFVLSFSPAYRPDAAQLWSTIGESLSRYLGGLMVSIIIQGAMATIGLTLLEIPYAVVLGLWMSATAILPYVGAFLGAIPAVLIALTISWQLTLVVIGLYILINQVEGNLITPRLQGTAVGVHPLVIFVSVIGGAEIAGALGAILAIPTLAIVRVLLDFLWTRLQVRQAHDTVLVALGGDDDGGTLPGEEAMRMDANVRAEDGAEVTINATDGAEIDVRVDDDATVDSLPTVYRPKPTVKPRRKPLTHGHRARLSTSTRASDQAAVGTRGTN